MLVIASVLIMQCSLNASADSIVPSAYQKTAIRHQIPPVVFYALALVETGQTLKTKKYRPWPWTLTINAKPFYFNTYEGSLTRLKQTLAEGEPGQLGIGLYQIEYRFHKDRFDTLEDMLDPYRNIDVAAQIFAEYYASNKGDLWETIGRFHSGTPDKAVSYQNNFGERLVSLIAGESR